MNIRESIKKVLQEVENQETYEMVSDFMGMYFPLFSKGNIKIKKLKQHYGYNTYFFLLPDVFVAKYFEQTRVLELSYEIFKTLEKYFGDDMTVVLDWFNNEFGLDAESVTF